MDLEYLFILFLPPVAEGSVGEGSVAEDPITRTLQQVIFALQDSGPIDSRVNHPQGAQALVIEFALLITGL